MSVDIDQLRSQWELIADRKTCSYGRQTSPGVYAFATVAETFYRDLAVSESQPSNAKYTRRSKTWYAPKSENTTLDPRVGDVWVDGSETYRVLTVGEAIAQGTWKLGTVLLLVTDGTERAGERERHADLDGVGGVGARAHDGEGRAGQHAAASDCVHGSFSLP